MLYCPPKQFENIFLDISETSLCQFNTMTHTYHKRVGKINVSYNFIIVNYFVWILYSKKGGQGLMCHMGLHWEKLFLTEVSRYHFMLISVGNY